MFTLDYKPANLVSMFLWVSIIIGFSHGRQANFKTYYARSLLIYFMWQQSIIKGERNENNYLSLIDRHYFYRVNCFLW